MYQFRHTHEYTLYLQGNEPYSAFWNAYSAFWNECHVPSAPIASR
jgi:hypothetical protein